MEVGVPILNEKISIMKGGGSDGQANRVRSDVGPSLLEGANKMAFNA